MAALQSSFMDRTAIGLSGVCAMHCLLLPLGVAMMPALSATLLGDEAFHRLLLIAVLPSSLLALALGCRKHGRPDVLLTGLVGLILLSLAAFFGHELFGEIGEKAATVLGALIIAIGHIRNQSLCRAVQCRC